MCDLFSTCRELLLIMYIYCIHHYSNRNILNKYAIHLTKQLHNEADRWKEGGGSSSLQTSLKLQIVHILYLAQYSIFIHTCTHQILIIYLLFFVLQAQSATVKTLCLNARKSLFMSGLRQVNRIINVCYLFHVFVYWRV